MDEGKNAEPQMQWEPTPSGRCFRFSQPTKLQIRKHRHRACQNDWIRAFGENGRNRKRNAAHACGPIDFLCCLLWGCRYTASTQSRVWSLGLFSRRSVDPSEKHHWSPLPYLQRPSSSILSMVIPTQSDKLFVIDQTRASKIACALVSLAGRDCAAHSTALFVFCSRSPPKIALCFLDRLRKDTPVVFPTASYSQE